MQGKIVDIARASLQDRMCAKMKPVKNAERRFTLMAIFSEVPCCTRSTVVSEIRYVPLDSKSALTRIRLDTCGYFARPNTIKESDILTQYGLKIPFPQPLRTNFPCVDPDIHECKSANKQADT